MTLSQLRTQVDALCRKYATQLEVYRLRPLAQEFCDEMTDAVIGPEPGPKLSLLDWIQILIKRGGRIRHPPSAIRPLAFAACTNYLQDYLDRRVFPQANDVLRSLLPKAAQRGLIPRSLQPIPF